MRFLIASRIGGAVGKDMVYMLSASYVLYYFQDLLGVNARFHGDHAVHQLFCALCHGEKQCSCFPQYGNMIDNAKRKTRLSHRWPASEHDQVPILKAACLPVKFIYPCIHFCFLSMLRFNP